MNGTIILGLLCLVAAATAEERVIDKTADLVNDGIATHLTNKDIIDETANLVNDGMATQLTNKDIIDETANLVVGAIGDTMGQQDEVNDNCVWIRRRQYTKSKGSVRQYKTGSDKECFKICRAIAEVIPGKFNGAFRYREEYPSEKWRGVCYCIEGIEGTDTKPQPHADFCLLNTGPAAPPKETCATPSPKPPKETCVCEKAAPCPKPPKETTEKDCKNLRYINDRITNARCSRLASMGYCLRETMPKSFDELAIKLKLAEMARECCLTCKKTGELRGKCSKKVLGIAIRGDVLGDDYKTLTSADCQKKCEDMISCTAYTYNPIRKHCQLLFRITRIYVSEGSVSGQILKDYVSGMCWLI